MIDISECFELIEGKKEIKGQAVIPYFPNWSSNRRKKVFNKILVEIRKKNKYKWLLSCNWKESDV